MSGVRRGRTRGGSSTSRRRQSSQRIRQPARGGSGSMNVLTRLIGANTHLDDAIASIEARARRAEQRSARQQASSNSQDSSVASTQVLQSSQASDASALGLSAAQQISSSQEEARSVRRRPSRSQRMAALQNSGENDGEESAENDGEESAQNEATPATQILLAQRATVEANPPALESNTNVRTLPELNSSVLPLAESSPVPSNSSNQESASSGQSSWQSEGRRSLSAALAELSPSPLRHEGASSMQPSEEGQQAEAQVQPEDTSQQSAIVHEMEADEGTTSMQPSEEGQQAEAQVHPEDTSQQSAIVHEMEADEGTTSSFGIESAQRPPPVSVEENIAEQVEEDASDNAEHTSTLLQQNVEEEPGAAVNDQPAEESEGEEDGSAGEEDESASASAAPVQKVQKSVGKRKSVGKVDDDDDDEPVQQSKKRKRVISDDEDDEPPKIQKSKSRKSVRPERPRKRARKSRDPAYIVSDSEDSSGPVPEMGTIAKVPVIAHAPLNLPQYDFQKMVTAEIRKNKVTRLVAENNVRAQIQKEKREALEKRRMRELNKYKNHDGLFFSKAGFSRLVRQTTTEVIEGNFRYQADALQALQYSAEMFITNVLEMANMASVHARRQTLMFQDMQLVYVVHSMASGPLIHGLRDGMKDQKEEQRKKAKAAKKKTK